MACLLEETTQCLARHGKTINDITWVGSKDGYIPIEKFIELADVEYDDGYGAPMVAIDLTIVGKDFFMTRYEYDGSEWWGYYSTDLFIKPKNELKIKTLIGNAWSISTLLELKEGDVDANQIKQNGG